MAKVGGGGGGGEGRISLVHRPPTAKRQKSILHFDQTSRIRVRIVFDPAIVRIIT